MKPRAPHRLAGLHPIARAALATAFLATTMGQASAQQSGDVAREVKALKDRIEALEKQVANQQPGMTPDQQQDFNRIAVKTEALEDARDMNGFKGLKVSGYIDPTFIFNQRQHRSGFQMADAVSNSGYTYDDSYMGIALLDFTKETDSGARWRLTLVPQRSSQAVAEGSSSPLHEASFSIPLTDLQTRFIGGWIPDWSGYEYLQATLTKTITHNLLFDTTEPTAYTGAGMEITRDKWIVKWLAANLSGAKRKAGEKTPVLAYRVDYAKGEFQGFGFAGVHGRGTNNAVVSSDTTATVNDGNDPPNAIGTVVIGSSDARQRDSRLDVFEFDAYFIRGDFTAQGQISFGRQVNASITPAADGRLRTAYWQGVSGLMAYKFEPRFEGVVRVDYIFNQKNGGGLLTYAAQDTVNGIGYAMQQDDQGNWVAADKDKGVNRGALTVGCNYVLNLNTVLKFEYRHDWATGKVFENTKTGGYARTNQLLGTSVVVSF